MATPGPRWFSRLLKAIEGAKITKAPASQWLAYFEKQGGFTREEFDRVLRPFLTKDVTEGSRAKTFTKSDVIDAVDAGHGKIGWTTGAQQADRYDLRKVIASVEYEPKRGHLRAVDHDGNSVVNKLSVSPDHLQDYVGGLLATKINAMEPTYGNGTRVLSGLDLSVGGEGMNTFYDKIMPNVVKDTFKKLGLPEPKITQSEVKLPEGARSASQDRPYSNKVWSVDIPPELHEKVKTSGMPLYAILGLTAGGAAAAGAFWPGQIEAQPRDATKFPATPVPAALPMDALGEAPQMRASGAGDRANLQPITRSAKMDEAYNRDKFVYKRPIDEVGRSLTGVETANNLKQQAQAGGIGNLQGRDLVDAAMMAVGPWGKAEEAVAAGRKLYHYSDKLLDVVDPAFAGSNKMIRGAERARPGAISGSHFYTRPGERESGLGSVLHTAEWPEDKIVDVAKPLPAHIGAALGPGEWGPERASKLEQWAKDNGFALENSEAGVVKVFDPINVTRPGEGRPFSDYGIEKLRPPEIPPPDTRGMGRPAEDYAVPPLSAAIERAHQLTETGKPGEAADVLRRVTAGIRAKPPGDWDPFDAAQAIFQSKKPR